MIHKLSIILPIHNERDNIAPLVEEIKNALVQYEGAYEIIAVDDGSTDGSLQTLREVAKKFPAMRIVVLRRNYGQSAAFDAGFRASTGDYVITLDADGQNDPADIPRMVAPLLSGEYDFVAGRRVNRKDGWVLRKIPSRLANAIIRKVTNTKLSDLGCSLKAYKRSFVDDLYLYGEMHRFIGVLMEDMGARTVQMDVNHRARSSGKSKYGLDRTVKVMLDLTTVWFMRGYQTKPIYVFGGAGIGLGILSFLLAMYVLYEKYLTEEAVFVHRNPLFILAVITAVIGVQFLVLGLLAEILVRTYFESRDRPSYIVRERVNFGTESVGRDAQAHLAELKPLESLQKDRDHSVTSHDP